MSPPRTMVYLPVALLLGACLDLPTQTAELTPLLSTAQQTNRPQEQQFHDLEARIPGYAGHFFGDDGTFVILLTDTTRAAAAREQAFRAVVQPRMRWERHRLRGVPALQVQKANYPFSDLATWRDATLAIAGSTDGVLSLDLVESANHIELGVSQSVDASTRAELLRRLHQAGIPTDAVLIADVDTAIAEKSTLVSVSDSLSVDWAQPLRGGVGVWAMDGYCTVGLVYRSAGLPFFFTSSHCTKKWGELDNDPSFVFTPADNSSFVIGTELNDYPHFGCGYWAKCLYADAAPISIGSYYEQMLTIARTKAVGSLVIDPLQPDWYIIEEEPTYVSEGDPVDKVGRTTGWTTGTIRRTCADFIVSKPNPTPPLYRSLLCQDQADYHAAGGDSGSPVFVILDSSASTVELAGFHSGRNWKPGDGFHLYPVFSPMRQVRKQYGFDPLWY